MTPYPDVNVTTGDATPVQGTPLDQTRLLIAMESFRGGQAPVIFRNPAAVGRTLEATGVGIPAFNAADVALRERVPAVHFVRLFGVTPVAASLNFAGTAGTSLKVDTTEQGEWANGAIGGLAGESINGPAGASERVLIFRRAGQEVARTSAASTRADLQAAVNRLPGFIATLGAELSLPLVAASANFTGGTADATTISATTLRRDLDRVTKDQGPMQVVAPGRNADATNTELLRYCLATNRTALLEQADGLAVGTITASGGVLRALGTGAGGLARLGGMWAQHATGPGFAGGTRRTVPWTIIMAGLIARLERAEGHPNVSPAGDFGVPVWADGVTRYFTRAEAELLFNAGCNVVEDYLGVPRNATFRSLDPESTSEWEDLAHTRTDRAIRAIGFDVGRNMGSRVVNRETVSEFGTRLRTRLVPFHTNGALFGDTFDEAVRVDTDTTNDITTFAAKEVNAAVGVKMGEHAEQVNVNIAKVPLGQAV